MTSDAPPPSADDRAAPRRARRGRLLLGLLVGVVLTGFAGAGVLLLAGDGDEAVAGSIVTGPQMRTTQPPWRPSYDALERRMRLAGLPAPGTERFHRHMQLRIYRDGLLVPIPANVGLDRAAKTFSALHTHDGTGVLHVEADEPVTATLGDLFAVWGVAFGPDRIGGITDADGLTVYVDGRAIEDPAAHVLAKDDNIVIAAGSTEGVPRVPDTTALDKANEGEALCSSKAKDGRAPTSCLVTPEGER